jgi:hypothetical protein
VALWRQGFFANVQQKSTVFLDDTVRRKKRQCNVMTKTYGEERTMATERAQEEMVAALRQGRIWAGEQEINLGEEFDLIVARLGAAAKKSQRRWEMDGFSFLSQSARMPVLWYRKGAVTLTFKDRRLDSVGFRDGRWRRAKDWDDYDYAMDLDNYRSSRAELERILGKPRNRSERNKNNLWATWDFGAATLHLHCESRTPSVGLVIASTAKTAPRLPGLPPLPERSRCKPAGLGAQGLIYTIQKRRDGCDQLGGYPPAALANHWPRCEECGKLMHFLAFFWAHPDYLPLRDAAALALFQCNHVTCDSFAPDRGTNGALLLRREALEPEAKADLPADAPTPLSPSRLGYRLRKRMKGPASRFGGSPHWLQAPQVPQCRQCGSTMAFVAQLDSGLHSDLNVGDGGSGYLFACPLEHDAAFLWQE